MATRTMSRQKSLMKIESNPTHTGSDLPVATLRVESLTDCRPIESFQLNQIITDLTAIEANEDRLHLLESAKLPYIFTSDDLAKLLEITPSIRTKIAMIATIAPRLMDPKAKISYFTGLFRYNEEKEHVEELLKARAQAMAAAAFTKAEINGGGRGGRGAGLFLLGRSGRGGRGRGFGGGSTNVSLSSMSTAAFEQAELHVVNNNAVLRNGTFDSNNDLLATRDSDERGRSASDDLGDDHTVTNFDDVIDSLDKMTMRSPLSSKKNTPKLQRTPTMDIIEEESESSLVPTVLLNRCESNNSVMDARLETSTPGTDSEARSSVPHISAEGTPGKTLETAVDSKTGRLSPTCHSPSLPLNESSSDTTGTESEKESMESNHEEDLLHSLSEHPAVESSVPTVKPAPITPAHHASRAEKVLSGSFSRRCVTLDELDIDYKEAARAAKTAPIVVDALVDPSMKENLVSPSQSFKGSIYSDKSTTSVHPGTHRVMSGGASIRLATVAATSNNLLSYDEAPSNGSYGYNGSPSIGPKSLPKPSVGTFAHHSKPAPTKEAVMHHAVTDTKLNQMDGGSKSNVNIDDTRPLSQSHRRNSDFFDLANGGATKEAESKNSVAGETPTVKATVTPIGIRPSLPDFGDLANKCAFLVHMSKTDFLTLKEEPGVDIGNGEKTYSYRELMRRNYSKQYGDLRQSELEKYLSDEEFIKVFQKTKAAFYAQVRWKQVEQKKKVLLF
eukprot:gene3030-3305_t